MSVGDEALGKTTKLGSQPWTSSYRDASGIISNGPVAVPGEPPHAGTLA